ncbi:cell envelope integrity protein TolA [Oceanospirillum linum]|uniref:Uncharacterized protein n=2 Tax=Oceanospirillum linum TaxID=966 RepID=A0A1T1HBL8_OCELI|nr:cell envelope integrity protein TolA [Oceanospirillum linum]OOV87150.1 hypothetical protein BTA35_0209140 [Oceanospirillum linum]SEF76183.1 hypothetical protein SAMN04489856_102227 [Oleiphilus messinensis]SMP17374.1 hypothetical protein SAMN06264348_103225 [Oceanospirillum linum]
MLQRDTVFPSGQGYYDSITPNTIQACLYKMDDKNLAPDADSAQTPKDLPSVPGVYPAHHKMSAAEAAEKEAEREREKIKAQWEAKQAEKKQEERKKAEEARLKAEREALYKDLETLNYELLSLSEYPSDFEIESARRSRLGWFFGLGISVFLFTSSLLNLVHPWVGGIAGGIAFVLWLSHGTGMMQFLPGLSRYPELLAKRRKIKNGVTEYIQQIEAKRGFIHRIYPLVHHNPRLRARKFRRIALMSKEHNLMSNMKTLQDVALYHEYLDECRKAAEEYFRSEREDQMLADLDFDPSVEDLEQELTDNAHDEESAESDQTDQLPEEKSLKTDDNSLKNTDEPAVAPNVTSSTQDDQSGQS